MFTDIKVSNAKDNILLNAGSRLATIPVQGAQHTHEYTQTITVPATCTEAGEATYTCTCGDHYTQVIDATGHTAGEWTVQTPPTCVLAGEETSTCVACGQDMRQIIPATGVHIYGDWVLHTAATCKAAGEERCTCLYCPNMRYRPVDALEHVYGKLGGGSTVHCVRWFAGKTCTCGHRVTQTLPATGSTPTCPGRKALQPPAPPLGRKPARARIVHIL